VIHYTTFSNNLIIYNEIGGAIRLFKLELRAILGRELNSDTIPLTW